jgi:chromosome segregation ATPase
MNTHDLIALIALVISGITLLLMLRGQRHEDRRDYVMDLEDEIKTLRREVDTLNSRLEKAKDRIENLEVQVRDLINEKVSLLAKLAGHEH